MLSVLQVMYNANYNAFLTVYNGPGNQNIMNKDSNPLFAYAAALLFFKLQPVLYLNAGVECFVNDLSTPHALLLSFFLSQLFPFSARHSSHCAFEFPARFRSPCTFYQNNWKRDLNPALMQNSAYCFKTNSCRKRKSCSFLTVMPSCAGHPDADHRGDRAVGDPADQCGRAAGPSINLKKNRDRETETGWWRFFFYFNDFFQLFPKS